MIDCIDKMCMWCGDCANICPKDAITIKFDSKGFYTPHVNKDKCVKCGKCIKVCAAIDYKSKNNSPKVFVIAANDEKRVNSTSDGAFAVLAKYVLDNKG